MYGNDGEESVWCGLSGKTLRSLMLTSMLGLILVLTYDRCVECVICVSIVSALTMSCVPTAPLIFVLSLGVLLMHAIDYRNATIKVEVPLENIVHIPTWEEVHKYVHVAPGDGIHSFETEKKI
jgi:hypothetical protein